MSKKQGKERACRVCHLITRDNVCPQCKPNSTLSDDFSGVIFILKPKESYIAKMMNINFAGKYALRVR